MTTMNVFSLALLGLFGGLADDPFAGGPDRLWTEPAADPPASDDFSYSFQIAPVFRWFTGHVEVREHQVSGSRLDLRNDLGLETGAGGNARFTVDAPGFQFQGEVEEIFGWGGRTADQPFAWNGTVYTTPSQVRVHSSFLTVRAELGFKLWGDEKGHSWLGPVVGLEYPYYTVSVGTNLQHGSLEDWVHYLPYSVAGVAGRVALSDAVDLGGRVIAGYLPNQPTIFHEGGRLYVSVRPSVALDVPITWHVGSSTDLSLTITYQYWDGGDHSDEDGNKLLISSPGVMLGVAFRW
jgi:hypothetical protein